MIEWNCRRCGLRYETEKPMKIRGILFDFDGTLSDRYASAYEMYRWLLQQIMPQEDPEDIRFEEMVQSCLLWDEYGTVSRMHAMDMIRKKYVPDLDTEYWNNVWYNNFRRFQKLQPGCISMLEELRKSYRLGILSNGPAVPQRAKIKALGLEPYFDMTLVSGEAGIHKPDPELFQMAAQRMGLSCEECAMIGDTFSTDISGAIRAGMMPVWFCRDRRGLSCYDVTRAASCAEVLSLFPGK